MMIEKRFKTSPFAWTNPLSGYILVVIPEGPQDKAEQFQLRLVKDPHSFHGANRNYRGEYVMKWMNKNPNQTWRSENFPKYQDQ